MKNMSVKTIEGRVNGYSGTNPVIVSKGRNYIVEGIGLDRSKLPSINSLGQAIFLVVVTEPVTQYTDKCRAISGQIEWEHPIPGSDPVVIRYPPQTR